MEKERMPLLTRTLNRARRLSVRARERVRGLPLRAAQRKRGVPVPPPRLIYLVAGSEDVRWFLESGKRGADCLRDVLGKHGVALEQLGAILDFGCGVGRVIRHFSGLQGPALYGSDYNPDLIGWCRHHLSFAQFQVNALDRPLHNAPASFDLVYALSVFTHLSEPLQSFWIDEMARVVKPGGHLFLTVHGASYLPQLSPEEQSDFHFGRLVVQKSERDGSNDCATFHPDSYVRSTLARGFQVIDHIPEGALGNPHQDVYLLKRS